jgi:ureidoglycolate lyase
MIDALDRSRSATTIRHSALNCALQGDEPKETKMDRSLAIEPLTAEAIAPFGWMLGKPCDAADAASFISPASDFWSEHIFDTAGGQTEMLWVVYRSRDVSIARLEAHLLTQQAIIPLTGAIIQIVGLGLPDGSVDQASVRAFQVPRGRGICMRPGCWHATRVEHDEVTCAMLTRRSTTLDLARHLKESGELDESAFQPVSLVLVR